MPTIYHVCEHEAAKDKKNETFEDKEFTKQPVILKSHYGYPPNNAYEPELWRLESLEQIEDAVPDRSDIYDFTGQQIVAARSFLLKQDPDHKLSVRLMTWVDPGNKF